MIHLLHVSSTGSWNILRIVQKTFIPKHVAVIDIIRVGQLLPNNLLIVLGVDGPQLRQARQFVLEEMMGALLLLVDELNLILMGIIRHRQRIHFHSVA